MIKPDLTLSMDDKVYLAVAKDSKNKTAFVYTLACLGCGALESGTYRIAATREVHAFQDKKRAQLYYDTVKRIVDINKSDNDKDIFFSINAEAIKRFNEHTR